MNRTKIEWVKNPDGTQGYTWNPITGCLNGCEYCYARKLANGRLRSRYLANENTSPVPAWYNRLNSDQDSFFPRFWEDRVKQMALYTGTGKGIFTCDMSDLFGIGVPTEWTEKVLFAINLNRRNRFYLLTKQPQNLIKFSPFPDNCWVGVSVTHQLMLNEALLRLIGVDAKVKFLSFEPLLGEINVSFNESGFSYGKGEIQGAIIGAQTKPYKPPKIEWVQEIVEACAKAGIPVFLKDNLKPLYRTIMPNDGEIYLRQEIPEGR